MKFHMDALHYALLVSITLLVIYLFTRKDTEGFGTSFDPTTIEAIETALASDPTNSLKKNSALFKELKLLQ